MKSTDQLRLGASGWASGCGLRAVMVRNFEADGSPTPKGSDVLTLLPNQTTYIWMDDALMPGRVRPGTRASAIVDGGEDVTVLVKNYHYSIEEACSYEGIPSQGERSGIGVGTTLFIPSWRNGRYNYYFHLYIQNINVTATTATVACYDDAGNLVGNSLSVYLPAGGHATVGRTGVWTGSARVTASGKAAVTVRHDEEGETKAMGYPAMTRVSGTAHFPSLFRNYYGQSTSLQVQDLRSFGSAVSVLVDWMARRRH